MKKNINKKVSINRWKRFSPLQQAMIERNNPCFTITIKPKKQKTKHLKQDPNQNQFSLFTGTYDEYLKSDIWLKIRNEAVRLQKCCYVCRSFDFLTVHHKCYAQKGREKQKHLVVLCWKCHKAVHNLMIDNKTISLKNAHEEYAKLWRLGIRKYEALDG